MILNCSFINRERDDLLKSVVSLRTSVAQAQARESELRQEVQRSLAAIEDVQLEKTQVTVRFSEFDIINHHPSALALNFI